MLYYVICSVQEQAVFRTAHKAGDDRVPRLSPPTPETLRVLCRPPQTDNSSPSLPDFGFPPLPPPALLQPGVTGRSGPPRPPVLVSLRGPRPPRPPPLPTSPRGPTGTPPRPPLSPLSVSDRAPSLLPCPETPRVGRSGAVAAAPVGGRGGAQLDGVGHGWAGHD